MRNAPEIVLRVKIPDAVRGSGLVLVALVLSFWGGTSATAGTPTFSDGMSLKASDLNALSSAVASSNSVGDVVASLLTIQQFQAQRGFGWVLCDGGSLGGTALGGLTGMNALPDVRGQFLRGFNAGRGDGKGDPDGDGHALGTYQADQFAAHSHKVPYWNGSGGGDAFQPAGGGGGASSSTVGGNETRPRNTAVNYFCRVN